MKRHRTWVRRVVLVSAAMACIGCSDGSGPEEDPPPFVWGFIVSWEGSESKYTGAPTFAAGDTIQFVIHASDNSRVRWLGFELSGLYVGSDSVEVTDSLSSVYVDAYVPTPTSAAGTIRVTGFARDDQGQRGEQELNGNPISLYITAVRPFVALDLDAPVRDVAFDAKRDLAFLSQPTENRIAVISTGSGQYHPALQPPAPPAGIDVTIGGDSLVASLPDLPGLGILNLNEPSEIWDTVDLELNSLSDTVPVNVRVAANDKAVVSLRRASSRGSVGSIIEYDFLQGTRRFLADRKTRDVVISEDVPMIRAPDGSRILLKFEGLKAALYVSATNTLMAPKATIWNTDKPMSSDARGRVFQMGLTMFDTTLTATDTLSLPGWVTCISPGGDTLYVGLGTGMLRTRIADGVTTERVYAPEVPLRVFVVPGPRNQVLILSETLITIVDLDGPLQAPLKRQTAGWDVRFANVRAVQ